MVKWHCINHDKVILLFIAFLYQRHPTKQTLSAMSVSTHDFAIIKKRTKPLKNPLVGIIFRQKEKHFSSPS